MVLDQARRDGQIQQFIDHLQRYIMVQEAILFGSHAYGHPHEWSDIDLVIISPDFLGQPMMDRLQFLYWATWEAGTNWIEPLGYAPEEIESATSLSLLGEVRERGLVYYKADGKETLGKKFIRAREKVNAYLTQHGAAPLEARIEVDESLEEPALGTHRYPDTVLVKRLDVPESVIAHELVHIAQQTLEHFQGFHLLYILLAEGLAEFVTKAVYQDHLVDYLVGYELIAALVASDQETIRDLLRLNRLRLVPEDVDVILANPHLPPYSGALLGRMAERIRETIRVANRAGIEDPTFVTLGEEIRAWKFLSAERFDGVREQVDRVIRPWFEEN